MKSLHKHTTKIFNDSVHGHIELHPLLVRVIDTPQFQRLRDIKQLSTAQFVYPGACHSRLEHSIGVCYLAGQLVVSLRSKQPELSISDKDVLCVELAGLCHDLGHGPFSHLFEQLMQILRPDANWKHESHSVLMLEHLLSQNELMPVFSEYGLDETHVEFVKCLIDRERQSDDNVQKSFLYEIVANKQTGIDVDKWDYFARDCQYLGIRSMFDHSRYIKYARVITGGPDNRLHIATRDKEASMVYEMYYTSVHQHAYQHPVAIAIGLMILDALVMANIRIPTDVPSVSVSLRESIDSISAFEKMTDSILALITYSTCPELCESRNLLRRIATRDLYRLAATVHIPKDVTETFSCDGACVTVTDNHRVAALNTIRSSMCFYNKREPDKAIKVDAEDCCNDQQPSLSDCCTVKTMVFVKESTKTDDVLRRFHDYCERYHLTPNTVARSNQQKTL